MWKYPKGLALINLGEAQSRLVFAGETVTSQQLLGIEINDRAAALAELVLWIGWLQWQIRSFGNQSVAEPVVHDYRNIDCRDAVLAWDAQEPAYGADGKLLTRWDGVTRKPHPVTGERVPDEAAQVPQWRYVNPHTAEWPQADFIVGNPPFIGSKRMRAALGDGYVDALTQAWPSVPDTADFVMLWWDRAADLVRTGRATRLGLITTNSLKQVSSRKVLERHLGADLSLSFAIADHPWVDSALGAAVRVSMTVARAGSGTGSLLEVVTERPREDGEVEVDLSARQGAIMADLRIGADVSGARPLAANRLLCWQGCKLVGAAFQVTPDQRDSYAPEGDPARRLLRRYWAGSDITKRRSERDAIDTFGLDEVQLRQQFPAAWQWLRDRVWPERATNRDAGFREKWWLFGRPRPDLRTACAGLAQYIVTSEVSKHRTFMRLHWPKDLIDGSVVAIAVSDGAVLGALSSQVHIEWALAAGGRMGVGNDPRYQTTTCFETFPFPADDTGLTPALAERIRVLAEQIDAHRKARQAEHEAVTLTGLYNVLSKLRRGEALTAKEKVLHSQGLVGVLQSLHDELDAAVLDAYGWSDLGPVPWVDDAAHAAWTEALLERLVALNTRRAAEEAGTWPGSPPGGTVRWLRPDFQDPQQRRGAAAGVSTALTEQPALIETAAPADPVPDAPDAEETDAAAAAPTAAAATRQPWPTDLKAQLRAVAELLAASPAGLSEAQIADRFTARGAWNKRLADVLATLEAVARARCEDGRWRGV